MKVLIYGATGMVGRAVLRECLIDPGITAVQTVGRSATGLSHPKLVELVQSDLTRYPETINDLRGYDACFFCLGVSSGDVGEDQYVRLTYDLTTAVARILAGLNAKMTFVYVSGAGTDSTESGSVMWARVKGRTENAVLALFENAYMFRPAAIEPVHGEISHTRSYRIAYRVVKPVLPLLRRLFPRFVITSEEIGRAMIRVARSGWPTRVLESIDIRDCARASRTSAART